MVTHDMLSSSPLEDMHSLTKNLPQTAFLDQALIQQQEKLEKTKKITAYQTYAKKSTTDPGSVNDASSPTLSGKKVRKGMGSIESPLNELSSLGKKEVSQRSQNQNKNSENGGMGTNLNDDMYDVIENEETEGILTPQLSKYRDDQSQATITNSQTGVALSPVTAKQRRLLSRDFPPSSQHNSKINLDERNKTTKNGRRKNSPTGLISHVEVETSNNEKTNRSVSHKAEDGFSLSSKLVEKHFMIAEEERMQRIKELEEQQYHLQDKPLPLKKINRNPGMFSKRKSVKA